MSERELFPLKSEQPESKDIQKILKRYLQFWYLFLLGGLLGYAGAYLYIRYYTVPQYRISSTVLIKDETNGSEASALGDLGVLNATKDLVNEVEVLLSRGLMERVVNELGLFTSYFVEGQVNDVEVYGKDVPVKIIISKFDSTAFGKTITLRFKPNSRFEIVDDLGGATVHKFGQQINKSYGTFTVLTSSINNLSGNLGGQILKVRFNNIKNVAAHYNNTLMIYPSQKDANVLKIDLIDPLPGKGVDIINKLIEVYNRESIEDKNLIAANTIEFLDERLKFITLELTDVEKDVEAFKRQNELTDVNTQASNYLSQANDYNRRLTEWAIQIDVLESIEKYLSESANQYKIVPSSLSIQDATLLSLINKFNELQLERERILRTAFPNNPLVLSLNDQLEILRGNILENLRNIKKGLLITSSNLRATTGQYETKIDKVPTMERKLLDINRQQAIKQNLYSYLLQKREEMAISLAARVSNIRVIDSALATDHPISPNGQTIYLMSILLGLSIPFAGIFLADLLNNKIITQHDVEELTCTPILGELIHNDSTNKLVVTKGSKKPIVETFRLIRAKLHFAAVDRENKTILVTSSISGEGKTFFCINLGASLALTGKRVVLLEMDLRNPKLTEDLALTQGVGISDYLVSSNVPISDLIKPVEEIEGLFVISSGPIPLDPAELIMSPKLTHLLNELKDFFDHIIIDSAPVGQVADAFGLKPLIDSCIYIVRYNYTLKDQIAIVDEIYKNRELSHPMIVLNDAKPANVGKYGYGYGYTYYPSNKNKFIQNIEEYVVSFKSVFR